MSCYLIISALAAVARATTMAQATSTLYEDNKGVLNPTPATTPPASGCALVTQQLSTMVFSYDDGEPNVSVTLTPDLYCQCGTTEIAGTSTSLITTVTPAQLQIFCAMGYTSPTPISTASLAMETGNASNPDWINVPCNYGSLATPESSNPGTLWSDAGGTAAWQAVVNSWYSVQGSTTLTFSHYVSQFFNGPLSWQCDDVGVAGGLCDTGTTIACVEGTTSQQGVVNSPGAYLIMNSMQYIHQVLDNYYQDTTAAYGIVNAQIGDFNTAFSTVETNLLDQLKKEGQLKLIFWGVLLVAGLLCAIQIGTYLEAVLGIASEALEKGLVKSAVTDITALLTTVWYLDTLTFQTNNIDYATYALNEFASGVLEQWQAVAQNTTATLFSDPSKLGPLLDGGVALANLSQSIPPYNLTQTLVAGLFANLLTQVWAGDYQLVIMSADNNYKYSSNTEPIAASCSDQPPWEWFGNSMAGDNKRYYAFAYVANNLGQSCAMINGKPYWLMTLSASITDDEQNYASDPFQATLGWVTNPEGLNGTEGVYGGLDISSVYANAINSWENNGPDYFGSTNSNDTFAKIVSFNSTSIDNIYGLVQIPVCSVFDIATVIGWDPYNQNGLKTWPCPNSTIINTATDGSGGWTKA